MRRIPQAMSTAVLLVLAACGSKDGAGGAAGGGSGDAASAGAAAPAAPQGEDSVAAALQSQGTPLATVRFTLPERPLAGRPFPLQLTFASPQGTGLQAWLESDDLVVVPDSVALEFAAPGTPITQELTLMAKEPGITELAVKIAAARSAAQAVYSVPGLGQAGAPAP